MIALALLLSAALAADAELVLPGSYSLGDPAPAGETPWWEGFDDPALSRLIDEAMGGNGDLASAWGQVEQARARATQSLAGFTPAVSFDVSNSTSPIDSLGFGMGTTSGSQYDVDVYHSNSAAFSASLNVDIWGRSVLGWRASRFDAMASQGDADAQALALATNVAEGWYDLVAARELMVIAETQQTASEELLELVELQYQRGDATALDLLQQRQQVASSRTQVPTARIQLRGAEQRLALLLGRSPVRPELPEGTLPELPGTPAVGAPEDLLVSRPDLRAVQARYDAAVALRRSANRAFLPSLQLSGQTGWQGTYFEEQDTQSFWGVTASASMPLSSGGANLGAAREATAGAEASRRNFQQYALTVTQEVEGALIQEAEQRALRDAWMAQQEAARLTWEESLAQYVLGLTSYINVLNALTAWQQAEQGALQAHRDMVSARIQLHDALGGAWTQTLISGD